MRTITKILGAGAVVAAVGALGTYAIAQQGHGFGPGRMGMGHEMGSGMMKGHGHAMGGFADPASRLGTLKTEIGIKAEQQTAWDAYAKVVQDTATSMQEHREHVDRDAVHKMEPKQRQDFAAAMLKQRQEAFEKVKAAAETLLTKLDDAQKAKASGILPGLVAAGSGTAMQHGMMGGPGMGHGKGRSMGPH